MYSTDMLFTTPNFLTGAANIMNLAGSFYQFNTGENDFATDQMAIEHDFKMIGQDIDDVLVEIKSKNKSEFKFAD